MCAGLEGGTRKTTPTGIVQLWMAYLLRTLNVARVTTNVTLQQTALSSQQTRQKPHNNGLGFIAVIEGLEAVVPSLIRHHHIWLLVCV